MFIVDANEDIYHIRGDTGYLTIFVTDSEGLEVSYYEAVLSVKKKLTDRTFLFQKKFANGECFIDSEDTADLKGGSYYYDIRITKTVIWDGVQRQVVETIGPRNYFLLNNVTTGVPS